MKFWKSWRRFIENQKGAYLVIVAVLLPLLLTFAGLAVDLGRGYAHKAKLQNAADAGVMAAAHIYFPDKSHDEVYEWAQRYMDANHGNEVYNIDQITVRTLKEGTSSTDKADTVLISLYASEKVPVSFMAVMGFDAMPVNVVATAKVTPKEDPKGSGVWGYAFICGSNRPVSECKPWPPEEQVPFQILNVGHKIIGKVHTNGAVSMPEHPPEFGIAHYDLLIDRGNFSTSLDSNRELWVTRCIDNYNHPDGGPATGAFTYDEKFTNPWNPNQTDWNYLMKFGYTDGEGASKEVVVDSTTKTSKLDISLSQSNSDTEAIYAYVENLRKTSGEWKEPQWDTEKSDNFVRTSGNYGNYVDHSNGFNFNWNHLSYKVIIADGDVNVNDKHLDRTGDYVVIISLHGDVNIALNHSVKALVYAPNGRVSYLNVPGTTFEGSIVGQQIMLNCSGPGSGGATYKWNDFGFGTGSGSGSSGSGSGSSSGSGGVESIILYKDEDSNYGNEQAI